MSRIETCINSRPLIALSDKLEDYSVLTPGHFLIGGPLVSLPEPSVLKIKENRLSRWQLLQQLIESFWKTWSRDYLHTLQQRTKWRQPNHAITPGCLLLIMSPGLPPSRWALGRFISVISGTTASSGSSQLKPARPHGNARLRSYVCCQATSISRSTDRGVRNN